MRVLDPGCHNEKCRAMHRRRADLYGPDPPGLRGVAEACSVMISRLFGRQAWQRRFS